MLANGVVTQRAPFARFHKCLPRCLESPFGGQITEESSRAGPAIDSRTILPPMFAGAAQAPLTAADQVEEIGLSWGYCRGLQLTNHGLGDRRLSAVAMKLNAARTRQVVWH